MVSVEIATIEDRTEWDSYVAQHASATPYHLMGWGLAIEEAYGHRRLYIKASDTSGAITGILPVIVFSKPLAKSSLCALPFCDVGYSLSDNMDIETAMLSYLTEYMTRHDIQSLEIRNRLDSPLGEISSTDCPPEKVSMIIELPENSEILLSSFKSKLRSQIRKAEKNGLDFTYGNSAEHIQQFYDVFVQNMRNLGSPVHSLDWFQKVIYHLRENSLIGIVSFEDRPIGAGIILFSGKKVVIPWASTLSEYNKLAPNMMLYWNLLKYASDNHYNYFDFGRSTPGEGTFKFKQQWGAVPWPLDWQVFDTSGNICNDKGQNISTSNLRAKVEQVWRKLPLPVTTFIGPRIRKYISL